MRKYAKLYFNREIELSKLYGDTNLTEYPTKETAPMWEAKIRADLAPENFISNNGRAQTKMLKQQKKRLTIALEHVLELQIEKPKE